MDFDAEDIALVVPTKDRPHKVRKLLETLCEQGRRPGLIVIVNGGVSISEVVGEFTGRLPLELYECHPPGQIRQKNLGVQKVAQRTRLVGFVDDDIEFDNHAFEKMIEFWNSHREAAAVSFNIVNAAVLRSHWLLNFALMTGHKPGMVLKSGQATSICQAEKDLKVDWVCGGCTIWKREILETYPHHDIRSSWAICEDVIYSYPIGKSHPLYIASQAKARHEHVWDLSRKVNHYFMGRTESLWRLYFVKINKDLKIAAFLWMSLYNVFGRVALSLYRREKKQLHFALGQVEGIFWGLTTILLGRNYKKLIEEKTILK